MFGSDDSKREREEAKEERRKQREHAKHAQQISFNESGQLSRDFLEGVLDTDELQENTLLKIQNYLHRTWFLSNMTDAEAHDQKHKLDVVELKIRGMHPPQESAVQGQLRAFVYDDPSENLGSLSPSERVQIESLIDTLKHAVIPRGRGGFEREALHTEVRESRTSSDNNEDDGGRLGLF